MEALPLPVGLFGGGGLWSLDFRSGNNDGGFGSFLGGRLLGGLLGSGLHAFCASGLATSATRGDAGLGLVFFTLKVGLTAAALDDFVVLLSHDGRLVCGWKGAKSGGFRPGIKDFTRLSACLRLRAVLSG